MHALRLHSVAAVLGLIGVLGGALVPDSAAQASFISATPCLPQHKYVKLPPPIRFPIPNGPTVIVDDVVHDRFSDCFDLPLASGNHTFNSAVTGTVDVGQGPQSFFDVFVTVNVQLQRTSGSGQTGTFDTEMLLLDISGGAGLPLGVMIRESPTMASLGKTSVTDIGGGLYLIDSFFDVFTELSLDGGMTWIPGTTDPLAAMPVPSRVELVAEPGALGLLALGLAVLGLRHRRPRSA